MTNRLAPGVFIEEAGVQTPSIPVIPTGISGFVGVAERGPIGQAVLVTSEAEYIETFGRKTPNAFDLAQSVDGFFQNGGRQLYVVRTAHYGDIDDPDSVTAATAEITLDTDAGGQTRATVTGTGSAPYALAPGQFLRILLDTGGPFNVTFDAAAATITAGATAPYAGLVGTQLTGNITTTDEGSPVVTPFTATFQSSNFVNDGAATVAEVALVIANAVAGVAAVDDNGGAPRITTIQQGTGAQVEVTGGPANAILSFSTTPVDGTGDVLDILAVTDAEAEALVEADAPGSDYIIGANPSIQSTTLGGTSTIQIDAASTATAFGFDNAPHTGSEGAAVPTIKVLGKTPGAYANELSVVITIPATNGLDGYFNLVVNRLNQAVESWPNLSMNDASDNYFEKLIAGSTLITLKDQDADAVDTRPAAGSFGPLTGGDDGLTSLGDVDFLGSSTGENGLHGFDDFPLIDVLALPGRATPGAHLGLIDYIETDRKGRAFGILDIPEGSTVQEALDYVQDNGLGGISSSVAIYGPGLRVLNTAKSLLGPDDELLIRPSGYIAGVYANNDRTASVWKAPAGTTRGQIRGIIGVETSKYSSENNQELLYPARINPIITKPNLPIHINGARGLRADANFPTVGERRGFIFTANSLKEGLAFLTFQPNTARYRDIGERTINLFLSQQIRAEAFASSDPATAYFIDSSTNINTPAVIAAGEMLFDVGLATAKPAEFVIVRIRQDTRALDESLAQG